MENPRLNHPQHPALHSYRNTSWLKHTALPLVFPDDEAGQAKRDRLLDEYDRWSSQVKGWDRT